MCVGFFIAMNVWPHFKKGSAPYTVFILISEFFEVATVLLGSLVVGTTDFTTIEKMYTGM